MAEGEERITRRRNTKRKGEGSASSGEDHLNEKYYTSRTHPHFHGSPVRAAALFDTAHCARCHRFTLYLPPLLASAQVYKRVVGVRVCATTWPLLSLSLSLRLLFFYAFLSFFFIILSPRSGSLRFKRAENRIIMRAGDNERARPSCLMPISQCVRRRLRFSMKGEIA